MATLEKAVEIAAKAHAGARDKHGQPYLCHPLRVMLSVDDDEARIAAVLHDVVEDTDVTLDDLRREGFTESVLQALTLLTHSAEVSYADYVVQCKRNRTACQVKLSDLRDNTSLSRALLRGDKFDADARRLQKYILSYRFLSDQLGEDDYRTLMARVG
jgi:hypothetical protein